MNEKVLGIVLKQSEYRENDALLTVLTKEYGKLTLTARGVKKMNSKSSTSCLPYVLSEFVFDYVEDKSMFTIKNASIKSSNRFLQEDLEKMNIAAIFCELIDKSLPQGVLDEDVNDNYFDLLVFSLDKLNQEKQHPLLLCLFLAQMLNYLGIPPIVDECVLCGNTKVNRISIEEGGFVCSECMSELDSSIDTQMDLKRFRLINKAGIENYDVLKNYGPWSFQDCSSMFEFLQVHSGIDSTSWKFLKEIVEV
ncbi:DNA repair protein RecO [Anaerorhabdus furcosa]|uniref:DNA repair protein RecO n=1 Tax=Anaerorhabdus furcosa TaxID=118967 RepID=A0A1T4N6S1_9FIRM|nr:DNA repair protein RecO [Anaerorhabdus furcosa]SJZ74786.1 DNA replication and repair protein RecO [Anaerorhabdus furcosa]